MVLKVDRKSRSNGINENILSSRDIQIVTMFVEVMAIRVAVIIVMINYYFNMD